MTETKPINFLTHTTRGAIATSTQPGSWTLQIPSGERGVYRLAQIDDYRNLHRSKFPWQPPVKLTLEARTSTESFLGTWGFGFWNDPFSFSLGLGGMSRRLPALPNAAWFFFASPPNFLSFRDDIPADGFFAGTFRSPRWPSIGLAPGLLIFPFLTFKSFARLFQRIAQNIIRQSSVQISMDVTEWHQYELLWKSNSVTFSIDGSIISDTNISPLGPLGLVIWIDNQYMALNPKSGFSTGTLPTPSSSTLKIRKIQLF